VEIREFLRAANERGWLSRVETAVSPRLEMASLINALGEDLTLFPQVEGWSMGVVAGLFASRRNVALALGADQADLLSHLVRALRSPQHLHEVSCAPCQECVEEQVDL